MQSYKNGQKVAEGTYDYRLTSGTNNDGLYIGYGLTQLICLLPVRMHWSLMQMVKPEMPLT